MRVHGLVTGPFQENTYLVAAGGAREAVLVDPGDEPDRIARALERLELRPVAILNTHGHLDHVGAVAELRDRYGIPFALHPADRFLVENLEEQAAMFGLSGYRDPEVDRELVPGESIELAGLRFDVLFTPGHTPGHVAFRVGDAVFSGDCLFAGSIGRTDLPGGDAPTLRRSLQDVLLALPDSTTVYPGHGPATTIGRERRTNPFLNGEYDW
jgi:hydroxyacylglutathione hydrolase